jgi:chromosome segregation ATPase
VLASLHAILYRRQSMQPSNLEISPTETASATQAELTLFSAAASTNDAADQAPADATPTEEPGPAADAGVAQPAELTPAAARKRLEEQLDALKRREAELRRELAITDHPELEPAIRLLEGSTYAVSRIEAKIAQGFSKAEERRRDTLEKKLGGLRDKRAELDTQIAELEAELHTLGDRARAFAGERRTALEQLLAVMSTHDAALAAAGLEATSLVPELARWLPEIRAMAETLVSERARS